MTASFIYDAVRTPFGKFNGGLAGVRPDDLAAVVLTAIRERNPGLDPAAVDTNIVALDTGTVPATEVVASAAAQGVRVGTVGMRTVRAVTHLDVTLEEAQTAGEVLGDVLARVDQAA